MGARGDRTDVRQGVTRAPPVPENISSPVQRILRVTTQSALRGVIGQMDVQQDAMLLLCVQGHLQCRGHLRAITQLVPMGVLGIQPDAPPVVTRPRPVPATTNNQVQPTRCVIIPSVRMDATMDPMAVRVHAWPRVLPDSILATALA